MTGYVIYFKTNEGQTLSVAAEADATTATISGLISGTVYNITVVTMCNNISSKETTKKEVIIDKGML